MNNFPEAGELFNELVNVGLCVFSFNQEVLQKAIEQSGYNVSCFQLSNDDIITELKQFNPDILLLNIRIIDKKSFLLDEIAALDIPIIFYGRKKIDPALIELATSFHPYSIMILPTSTHQIKATIDLAIENHRLRLQLRTNVLKSGIHTPSLRISVKSGYKTHMIEPSEILYGYSDHIYTIIVTRDREIVTRSSIAKMLERIKNPHFVQIHRRFFVNLQHATAMDRKSITIHGKVLPIGDSFKNKTKDILKK